ncbi:MAG: isoprenylcysteine carboxylmethyltransferase family protein [Deltaproteobacteria bacterium]
MNKFVSHMWYVVDSLIYLFIGPFNVLYVIPIFFRGIESFLGIKLQQFNALNITGTVLLWIGAFIAIWCSVLMLINRFGSIVPFFKPTILVTSGPFSQVRHPMMWALFIVLFGEMLIFSSPFTLLWLLLWIRFSIIYIGKFEEPYLHRHFGDIYQKYSNLVPRWLPKYFA